MKNLGVILIVVGIILMLVTGINVVTKKNVVDLGKVEINKEENNPVRWSPIVGGIILAAGIVVFLTNRKRTV
jgi:hypothetical protein